MPRVPQSEAKRGSQKWLQAAVNAHPDLFQTELQKLRPFQNHQFTWLSPLVTDEYAEYRDQTFLRLLGVSLEKKALAEFWPARGPVWDGLGTTDKGHLILVEAKAHIGEIVSPASKASPKSRSLIEKSLLETAQYCGSKHGNVWSSTFYQYTNRLAHLYLLRVLNGLPAHLVFLYFVNAAEMRGPETRGEWQGAINHIHAQLGLGRHPLSQYVHDVFVNVKDLGS
jgi:hypothetical protein